MPTIRTCKICGHDVEVVLKSTMHVDEEDTMFCPCVKAGKPCETEV